MEAGGDLGAFNSEGLTALDIAAGRNHLLIVCYLRTEEAFSSTQFWAAADSGAVLVIGIRWDETYFQLWMSLLLLSDVIPVLGTASAAAPDADTVLSLSSVGPLNSFSDHHEKSDVRGFSGDALTFCSLYRESGQLCRCAKQPLRNTNFVGSIDSMLRHAQPVLYHSTSESA